MQRLNYASSTIIIIGTTITANPLQAQVIPDRTTNSSVINNCQVSCSLTGGIAAGDNLFHSFQEFNIAPEASVYFEDPGVANIFSRVTGSNPSNIFGTLGVRGGDANLFLLNPNGIIFGDGAALDLNGSFFATTADEIQFDDRSLTAIPDESENLPLLTVHPSALLFARSGQNGAVILNGANLDVPEGENIALLGQANSEPGIELSNSIIRVTEGNISLGAVQDRAEIKLSEDFQLEFASGIVPGDIAIGDRSQIDALDFSSPNEHEIHINTDNLAITGNSTISTTAVGTSQGAKIAIDARSSVKIIGAGAESFQEFIATSLSPEKFAILDHGLQTNTFGSGNAGDVEITTPELAIDRGAGIVSATNSQGKSGNVNLEITEQLTLRGSGLVTGSSIFSTGNVGEININTKQLLIEQNGVISSSTLGAGNAGNLTIAAAERVEIKDTLADAVIPTGIFTNTVFENGNGGNLNLKTPELLLQNGGQLSASSGAITSVGQIELGGKGGKIELDIGKYIAVEGTSADHKFSSAILSDTRTANLAGNLEIETGDLYLDSDAIVSASSFGNGKGGNIQIDARHSITVEGAGTENLQNLIINGLQGTLDPANIRGGIAAFTLGNGEAGSIDIVTANLNLDRGAVVSTATYGSDDAGDLTISASEEINIRGSAIISPSLGAGDGGNIELQTAKLNITEGGAVASATLGSSRAGDIKIVATDSVAIFKIIPNLLFSGSISTGSYGGQGTSGNLTIDTQRLTIQDGANIETNNVALQLDPTNGTLSILNSDRVDDRTQGKLSINATDSIEISGAAEDGNAFNQSPQSHISSVTSTSHSASNVEITTGSLSIYDRGEISVSSLGAGAAGMLTINADSVNLSNRANLNGTTVSGRGGNIELQVNGILSVGDRSKIDTNASEGNGGNINIDADFVIAESASAIGANAFLDGKGGNIRITANDIFLTADSSITADSALGIDGTVKVTTLLDTERNNLTQLPQQVIQTNSQVTRSCNSNDDRQGIFAYTGRGGLPFNPLTDFQTDELLIADLDIPTQIETKKIQLEENSQLQLLQPLAVEADRWQVNDQGKLELTASSTNALMLSSPCPFKRQAQLM